jgi:hypothetical protein
MGYFTSTQMAANYLNKYELVLNRQKLNAYTPVLKEVQTVKFLPFLP